MNHGFNRRASYGVSSHTRHVPPAIPEVTKSRPVAEIPLSDDKGAERTLSVIMPAYGVADYIGEAVDSVRSQKMPRGWKREIVIGIDACESTASAVRKMRGVKALIGERNAGAHVMRNSIYPHTSGSVVVCVDPDDAVLPGWAEAIIGLMAGDTLLTNTHYIACGASLDDRRAEISHPPMACWALRRDFLLGAMGGAQMPWRVSADTEFAVRALQGWRAPNEVLPEPLYLYRRHPGQLTNDAHLSSDRYATERAWAQKYIAAEIARYAEGDIPFVPYPVRIPLNRLR